MEEIEEKVEVSEPIEVPKAPKPKRRANANQLKAFMKAIDNNPRMTEKGKKSAKKKLRARIKELKSKK